MTTNPSVSRRGVLAAGVIGAGATVLASCSSDSSGHGAATTAADAGGSSGAAGSSTTSSGGGATSLATLADIPIGEAVAVDLPGGKPGIVARPESATAVCFSAICTHQGCTVKPAGKTLDCPCHSSQYDAKTGAVLSGPAPSPLARVAVKVAAGKVVTV